MLFNDLLHESGINPADVRLLRHHTDPGLNGMSLFELWQNDVDAFDRYQSTQKEGRRIFRTAKYFASFVCPDPTTTLFVGLYSVTFDGTRQVEWDCPYRGNKPGDGIPVDVFDTSLRPELSEQIGRLKIAWDRKSVRNWKRYAAKAPFPVFDNVSVKAKPLVGQSADLDQVLPTLGFELRHSTKKVQQFQRGNIVVYVKRETQRFPLVVHPHYFELADEVLAIEGVECDIPLRPYINSNLGAFPIYRADHRQSQSHYGFALDVTKSGLAALTELLDFKAIIKTPEGDMRVFGTEEDPLTEQERLATARIGQGEFRSALINLWSGACPIAEVNHLALLRASHIKPWKASNNAERLDPYNGILLCAHIDALFDRGLISFEDDGKILISDNLGSDNVSRLGLTVSHAIGTFDPKHRSYLAHHREHVFKT